MGEALLAAAEPRQRRAAAVGGHALPGDWKVTAQGDMPAVVPLEGAALLGPPGACPAMEVSGTKPPITLPAMDGSQLQVGKGLAQLHVHTSLHARGLAGHQAQICMRLTTGA